MVSLTAINDIELNKCIRLAYENDADLIKYYDRTVLVHNNDEMIADTYNKLIQYPSYFSNCSSLAVMYENKPIGFVYKNDNPNLLVSFSVGSEYRKKPILSDLFNNIVNSFDGSFVCYLYEHNTRAINWLKKCGMIVESEKNNITTLKF